MADTLLPRNPKTGQVEQFGRPKGSTQGYLRPAVQAALEAKAQVAAFDKAPATREFIGIQTVVGRMTDKALKFIQPVFDLVEKNLDSPIGLKEVQPLIIIASALVDKAPIGDAVDKKQAVRALGLLSAFVNRQLSFQTRIARTLRNVTRVKAASIKQNFIDELQSSPNVLKRVLGKQLNQRYGDDAKERQRALLEAQEHFTRSQIPEDERAQYDVGGYSSLGGKSGKKTGLEDLFSSRRSPTSPMRVGSDLPMKEGHGGEQGKSLAGILDISKRILSQVTDIAKGTKSIEAAETAQASELEDAANQTEQGQQETQRGEDITTHPEKVMSFLGKLSKDKNKPGGLVQTVLDIAKNAGPGLISKIPEMFEVGAAGSVIKTLGKLFLGRGAATAATEAATGVGAEVAGSAVAGTEAVEGAGILATIGGALGGLSAAALAGVIAIFAASAAAVGVAGYQGFKLWGENTGRNQEEDQRKHRLEQQFNKKFDSLSDAYRYQASPEGKAFMSSPEGQSRGRGENSPERTKYAGETSGYGWRSDPTKGGAQFHQGIDFAGGGSLGMPVKAAGPGKVTFAGWDQNGGGNYVKIDHGHGLETEYLHLEKYEVKPGDTVTQGQMIGRMGNTGEHTTGVHVHFAAKRNGQFVNPESVITDDSSTSQVKLTPEAITGQDAPVLAASHPSPTSAGPQPTETRTPGSVIQPVPSHIQSNNVTAPTVINNYTTTTTPAGQAIPPRIIVKNENETLRAVQSISNVT